MHLQYTSEISCAVFLTMFFFTVKAIGLVVIFCSGTILLCIWSPEDVTSDFDKLARIMYLYDSRACGRDLHKERLINNVILDNNTRGASVLPIQWKPPEVTSSTRLSTKTRMYVTASMCFHVVWMLTAVLLIICKYLARRLLKIHRIMLAVFFYYSVCVIIFDLSMALVYIADIQQSLTTGMVLRYSGWGVDIKLNSYDEFAGWLPIIASICWMKGIVILALNIYLCRVVNHYRSKLKWRKVKIKLKSESNLVFPENKIRQRNISILDQDILYYRSGECIPTVSHYN